MRCVSTATASASALGAAVLAALFGGCGNLRETDDRPQCATYTEGVGSSAGVQTILDERCAGCHGGAAPAGGYSVEGHLAALSRRLDGTARVEPGNGSSLLLLAAAGGLDTPGVIDHPAIPENERAQLAEWVVDCRAAPERYRVHIAGWMSPPDKEQFHGYVLRDRAYDDSTCRDCHGSDLGGGTVDIACAQCHSKGVYDCSTCHGNIANAAPPQSLDGIAATSAIGVGAHQAHVNDGPLHKAYDCTACHPEVTDVFGEGHFRRSGQLDDLPAEVSLPARPGSAVQWNRANATCVNSGCHAPSADDQFASVPAPRWTAVGEGQAVCGACHGLPPGGDHPPVAECQTCHRPAFAQGQLDPAMHANGTVDFVGADGTCTGCHGDATSPAPPMDLDGNSSEQARTVGAHRAHLEARHLISARIACNECHLVPQSLKDPGHIDTARPAEVFPAGAGTLARSSNATPTYDPALGTCTNYCHGSGDWNADDTGGIKNPAPSWTGGTSQAPCGGCHNIPPRDFHTTALQIPPNALDRCAACHPATMNPTGNLIVTVDPVSGAITTTHLNGTVNVGP